MEKSPPVVERRVNEVRGRVVDVQGAGIRGAVVAIIDPPGYKALATTRTGSLGDFRLNGPSTEVVISATAQNYQGAYARLAAASTWTELRLTPVGSGSRRIVGRVATALGEPLPNVLIRVARWGWPPGRAYYSETDGSGVFRIEVPRKDVEWTMSYDVSVDDRDYVSDFADTNKGYENLVLIAHTRVAIERPTDNLTRKYLGSFCHALDDQHGVLDEIAASVKDARIIGLGEATHGTREFTEWRTRIVERLAVGGRLTTIGLEAGWEETLRIDDYVRRGIGTAREAVSSLRYFLWRTKEFVDLVEKVRAINVNRKASDRVEFFGIEVDPPKQMVESMLARLQKDGPLQSFAETSVRGVREWDDWSSVVQLGASQREQIKGALAKLMRRLQSSTGTNGEVASDRDLAMQSLSAIEMTIKGAEAEGAAFLGRDRLMAESQLLLLGQPEKQRQIAVWAHNAHIAKAFIDGDMPSGSFLYRKLGDRYVALATLFFEGSLLASRGPGGELIEYLAPAPPLHFTEHDLAAAPGKVGCFVNLLEASKDSRVREWMRRPRPLRIYGAFEISEHFPWPPEKLSDLWSSILFVRHSTASEAIQK